MNKNVYMILLALIASTTFYHPCYTKNSFREKISSFLQGKYVERVDQQEFSAATLNSLSLTAVNGSVTIKTGPKKSLFLRTIKRAKKEEVLQSLHVVVEIVNNHLAISTKNNNKKGIGTIDYELIVPASLDIALNINGNGNVSIKDVQGLINILTKNDVTLVNTKKLASVHTKKGPITIINAHGPVEAHTRQGAIIGENIAHSFDGRSTTGKINIAYKKLPSTGYINLTTTTGNVTLTLPNETNAEISGHTTYGTFMSDHEITLASYTTKLNKAAWNQFTKQVNGTLGTGDAPINITSTKGNIKILEMKST